MGATVARGAWEMTKKVSGKHAVGHAVGWVEQSETHQAHAGSMGFVLQPILRG